MHKEYNYEEYLKQATKDTKKLSELFANLSKSIENLDRDSVFKYFKKIARLMNLNRYWNGFPCSLMKYMDLDFYKRFETEAD